MSSYTKYHKDYNESKSTKKFTMELNELERFGLNEYAKFKNKKLKILLLDCLEKVMFTDKDYVKSLGTAGSTVKSIKQLYEAEQKRLADEQKAKEKKVRKQELARLRKIEKAKAKEKQAKALNVKAETPVKAKKTEDKKPPVKNRMKFLSEIVSEKPKQTVSIKTKPVKVPEQMSILEEVAKATEKEEAQPGKSKKPINKAKNSKQAEGKDKQEFGSGSKGVSNSVKAKEVKKMVKSAKAEKPDKSEFGPGSKGVSKSVARKPAKTGIKGKTKKGGKG
jgi:hypothetical protein